VRCEGLGVKAVGDRRNGCRSVVIPCRCAQALLMMFKAPLSLPRQTVRLDNSKISEIRFRCPHWMKEDFSLYCEINDVPAAHVLRQCIRKILTETEAVKK